MTSTLVVAALLVFVYASTLHAATKQSAPQPCDARSTGAYAELVLRKVEAQAEQEADLTSLGKDHPQVKARQTLIDAIVHEMEALCLVPRTKYNYLNEHYGKLLLKKIDLAAKLQLLLEKYTLEWPEAKRTKAQLGALEREMAKILQ